MGTWSYQYDTLNRLASGSYSSGPNAAFAAVPGYCWMYDIYGNRLARDSSNKAFPSGSGGANAFAAGGPSFPKHKCGCPALGAVLSRQGWEGTNLPPSPLAGRAGEGYRQPNALIHRGLQSKCRIGPRKRPCRREESQTFPWWDCSSSTLPRDPCRPCGELAPTGAGLRNQRPLSKAISWPKPAENRVPPLPLPPFHDKP